jgi:uncharacterized protein (TIGR02453 family)
MEAFGGFPAGTLDFLAELSLRNERAWFEANKARYERDVREPARAFIRAMGPRLGALSPHFTADDRKVGGSLMRVHRDTRFSKDKAPYKTNVGIQFRHDAGKDVHAPGLYVHIAPDGCFLGAGLWHPEPDVLRRIREQVADKGERWTAILSDEVFAGAFRQDGERLKRVPRGFDAGHPQAEELKRTSFIAVADLEPAALRSPAVADEIAARFATARSYLSFLCASVGLPF